MTQPTRILLVEDNPVDVRLVCFALEEEKSWVTEITVVEDGERAMDYLSQSAGTLDLIILDLNLPRRDGTEVLRMIRSTERLASLPVIVLSSSPEDISESRVRALDLYADSYLRKPVGASEFTQLGERIRDSYRQASANKRSVRSNHAS